MVERLAGIPAGSALGTGENVDETPHNKNQRGPLPPTDMTQAPGWGAGMALGDSMAKKLLESNPAWKAAIENGDMSEDDLKAMMQNLMTSVMKSMGEAAECFNEFDDEEDKGVGFSMP